MKYIIQIKIPGMPKPEALSESEDQFKRKASTHSYDNINDIFFQLGIFSVVSEEAAEEVYLMIFSARAENFKIRAA